MNSINSNCHTNEDPIASCSTVDFGLKLMCLKYCMWNEIDKTIIGKYLFPLFPMRLFCFETLNLCLICRAALEPPVLLQNLTDCTVNVSSSLILRCPSRGIPPPTVTWYKDERALSLGSGEAPSTQLHDDVTKPWTPTNTPLHTHPPKTSGIVISAEDGTLHIDRITGEDQGLYTCQATNERGSAESSAHIWVNGKSPPSSAGPKNRCHCL